MEEFLFQKRNNEIQRKEEKIHTLSHWCDNISIVFATVIICSVNIVVATVAMISNYYIIVTVHRQINYLVRYSSTLNLNT